MELQDDPELIALDLIKRYTQTWRLLLNYDEKQFTQLPATKPSDTPITYRQIQNVITNFRRDLIEKGEASSIFGQERDHSLNAILGNIEQTAFKEPLYQTCELKAAHLLYFIVKDHPFVDGNKRIGALLFLLYLANEDYTHPLDPCALTTLTLLLAQSSPESKDLMIELVVSLLRVTEH
ncbi:MAG: Fic family protein [Gammaproteobacteria bacterium]|nr:Fic family protein [Gammaproteobacteria bacterium]